MYLTDTFTSKSLNCIKTIYQKSVTVLLPFQAVDRSRLIPFYGKNIFQNTRMKGSLS